ncbi:dolichol phosphate mannosyltransferas-like protein subunit 3 [Polyplosphaeria fusca]|uniref:Dolichol-phosphate mannosyltransferase subunit 3 n=1 Tax=Polyplosphaeria fusca TaxID=682080 RepID=A0A9P4QSX8_9PLEO|nr:dolichol phosphate mannosyltransferas-like protein subunit 3 [Polyplosphaeria fusca]
MTRAQQTISVALLLTSLYLAVFMEVVPLPEKIQDDIVPVLPFWALISFGSYLLFKLGLGVFTFNDVPDAHKELMAQIKEARADLQAKGVDVGSD